MPQVLVRCTTKMTLTRRSSGALLQSIMLIGSRPRMPPKKGHCLPKFVHQSTFFPVKDHVEINEVELYISSDDVMPLAIMVIPGP